MEIVNYQDFGIHQHSVFIIEEGSLHVLSEAPLHTGKTISCKVRLLHTQFPWLSSPIISTMEDSEYKEFSFFDLWITLHGFMPRKEERYVNPSPVEIRRTNPEEMMLQFNNYTIYEMNGVVNIEDEITSEPDYLPGRQERENAATTRIEMVQQANRRMLLERYAEESSQRDLEIPQACIDGNPTASGTVSMDMDRVRLSYSRAIEAWHRAQESMLEGFRGVRYYTTEEEAEQKERDEAELKAQNTLRELIGEKAYIRYKADEFVSLFGKSGRLYRVYPGDRMTEVFDETGKLGEVCVVHEDQHIPPTDSIISRMTMIQSDESGFYDKGNLMGGIEKP